MLWKVLNIIFLLFVFGCSPKADKQLFDEAAASKMLLYESLDSAELDSVITRMSGISQITTIALHCSATKPKSRFTMEGLHATHFRQNGWDRCCLLYTSPSPRDA